MYKPTSMKFQPLLNRPTGLKMNSLRFIFLFLAALLGNASFAKWEDPIVSTRITPVAPPAVPNSLSIEDLQYNYMVANSGTYPTEFTNVEVQNQVVLGIDRDGWAPVHTKGEVHVTFNVMAYYEPNLTVGVPSTQTLIVKYDHNFLEIEQDKNIYTFTGAHKVDISISAVTDELGNPLVLPATNVPSIYLETEMNINRIYEFDKTISGVASPFSATLGVPYGPNLCDDEVEVTWNMDPATTGKQVEAFELEYLFIDESYAATQGLAFCPYSFRHNATRIRLTEQSWKIPHFYSSGFVLFRVRALGKETTSPHRWIEGEWSMSREGTVDLSMSLNVFAVNPHEADLNWEFGVNFSEEGKLKGVISYMDGTLRVRQTQTKLSTDGTVVVDQNIYDHVGRPTINVLPAPVLPTIAQPEPNMCFRPNFNNSWGTTTQYASPDFDYATSLCDPLGVNRMDPGSGASYYYSNQNSLASSTTDIHRFIPDAQGYPFSQVEYMPDPSGRIRRTSGFGLEHRLTGKDDTQSPVIGHEFTYYYGSPFQEELYRLFGNEVGNREHYQKNMVVDANGQVGISIVDPYGNTIATALAGVDGTNPGLEPVSTFNADSAIDIQFESPVWEDEDFLEVKYKINVPSTNIYEFDYTITPSVFSDPCLGDICYSCVYDLELFLTDECGDTISPDSLAKRTVGSIDSTTWSCDTAVGFTIDPGPLSLTLNLGTYHLTKRLSINQAAIDYYKEKYLEQDTCLLTFDDFAQAELNLIDSTDCNYGCADCYNDLDSLKDQRDQILAEISAETDPDKLDSLELLKGIYIEQIAIQEEDCDFMCLPKTVCDVLYQQMIEDVSPGGQYALYIKEINGSLVTFNDGTNNGDFPYSLLNSSNTYYPSYTNYGSWKKPHDWGTGQSKYKNRDGSISVIAIDDNNLPANTGSFVDETGANAWSSGQKYILPEGLIYYQDFKKYWKNTWAKELIWYHPEYVNYEKCSLIDTSYKYDQQLINTEKYDVAVSKGYFNPMNYGTNGTYNQGGTLSENFLAATGLDPHDPMTIFGDNGHIDKIQWFVDNLVLTNEEFKEVKLEKFGREYEEVNGKWVEKTGGTTYSIWELFLNDIDYKTASTAEEDCYEDQAWIRFRAMYLSAKNQFVKNYYTNVTIPAGKSKRFELDPLAFINGGAMTDVSTSFSGSNNPSDQQSEIVEETIEQCKKTCESYADDWIGALEGCTLTTAEEDSLRARLVRVCRQGCDIDNPVGSVNVLPQNEAAADYVSFRDVLDNMQIFNPGICDDLLIQWPYNVGHDYLSWENPDADTCACDTVYSPFENEDCDSTGNKDTLDDCPCEITTNELRNELLGSMDLRPSQKCQNCVDCEYFQEAVQSFVRDYTDLDYDGLLFKQLLTTSVNRYLGFNLTYQEYEDFAKQCINQEETDTNSVWIDFERRRYAQADLYNPYNEFIEMFTNPENSFEFAQTERKVSDLKSSQIDNFEERSLFSQVHSMRPTQKYRSSESDLASITDFYLGTTDARMFIMAPAAASADDVACQCEKILSAGYMVDKGISTGSKEDAYVRLFGAWPPTGVTTSNGFDAYYDACCKIFNLVDPPNQPCDPNNFTPGDKFSTASKDYINDVINDPPGTYPELEVEIPELYDADCDNELPEVSNDSVYLDTCACNKLLLAEYDWLIDNKGFTDYSEYLFNEYKLGINDAANLLAKCKEKWNDDAGEASDGTPISWTPIDFWDVDGVGVDNLNEIAIDEDLFVPRGLSCDSIVPTPGVDTNELFMLFVDCDSLIHWFDSMVAANPHPSPPHWNPNVHSSYQEYLDEYDDWVEDTKEPYEQMMKNAFNDRFGYDVSSTEFRGAESYFSILRKYLCCKNPSSCQGYTNSGGKWTKPKTPKTTYPAPIQCDTCYVDNFEYLKAWENSLNQILQPNRPLINASNWLLINSSSTPVRDISEFHSSVIYETQSCSAKLRYKLKTTKVPNLSGFITDASCSFRFPFTFHFPSSEPRFNWEYVRSVHNIRLLERTFDCTFPTIFIVDAVIEVPEKYTTPQGQPGVTDTIVMYGTVPLMPIAEEIECLNDCILLCNRPVVLPVKIPDECMNTLKRVALNNAKDKYDDYRDSVEIAFERNYIEQCMSGFTEDFDLHYDTREYHYTLHYYDQSGALIKTVPPEGVRVLSTNEISNAFLHRANSANPRVIPKHQKITNYQYNTLGKVARVHSPDGGIRQNWYDELGRLVVSQNAVQEADDLYSYIIYDDIGRIIESGEISNTTPMTPLRSADWDGSEHGGLGLEWWLSATSNRKQVTKIFFDETVNANAEAEFNDGTQHYLRNRVSGSIYQETYSSSSTVYNHATHFSYDIHGNVNELVQDFPTLTDLNHRYKKMAYEFNLISGGVKKFAYQEGEPDQFYHKYSYNADNGLLNAETSRKNWESDVFWERDATYFFYKHGSMARLELGELNVQGIDYAYTINGWLKGVNAGILDPAKDMGMDGNTAPPPTNPNQQFAKDAFGFTLAYYNYDYLSISGVTFESDRNLSNLGMEVTSRQLYNGNISHMATALPNSAQYTTNKTIVNYTLGNVYTYDKLNRLREMKVYDGLDAANVWQNTGLQGNQQYYSNYTYDGDGNLLTLDRNGDQTGPTQQMDDLSYNYLAQTDPYYSGESTNKLDYVGDAISQSDYHIDIDNQNSGNYEYNAIGNLIKDIAEEIDVIEWNANGKIKAVKRTAGSTRHELGFSYDQRGNRVSKTIKPRAGGSLSPESSWSTQWYVRDASGLLISTYTTCYVQVEELDTIIEKISLNAFNIYGAKRLGEYRLDTVLSSLDFSVTGYDGTTGEFQNRINRTLTNNFIVSNDFSEVVRGRKSYELTNHLGNVLAVVTDRKIGFDLIPDGIFDEYNPELRSFQDYYPYGMLMPGREYKPKVRVQPKFIETGGVNIGAQNVLTMIAPGPWAAGAASKQKINDQEGVEWVVNQSKDIMVGLSYVNGDPIPGPNNHTSINYGVMVTGTFYDYYQNGTLIGGGTTAYAQGDKITILRNNGNIEFYVNGTLDHFIAETNPEKDMIMDLAMKTTNSTINNLKLIKFKGYGFGFNSQEKDDEISGSGNSYTAMFWQYSSRLGRRFRLDPVVKDHVSGYLVLGDNPILMIDPNGDDWYRYRIGAPTASGMYRYSMPVWFDGDAAELSTGKDSKYGDHTWYNAGNKLTASTAAGTGFGTIVLNTLEYLVEQKGGWKTTGGIYGQRFSTKEKLDKQGTWNSAKGYFEVRDNLPSKDFFTLVVGSFVYGKGYTHYYFGAGSNVSKELAGSDFFQEAVDYWRNNGEPTEKFAVKQSPLNPNDLIRAFKDDAANAGGNVAHVAHTLGSADFKFSAPFVKNVNGITMIMVRIEVTNNTTVASAIGSNNAFFLGYGGRYKRPSGQGDQPFTNNQQTIIIEMPYMFLKMGMPEPPVPTTIGPARN